MSRYSDLSYLEWNRLNSRENYHKRGGKERERLNRAKNPEYFNVKAMIHYYRRQGRELPDRLKERCDNVGLTYEGRKKKE